MKHDPMICIVGGGVAGFQAAATCRVAWPDKAVMLIDTEKTTGYYRTLLPQFMAGELPEEKLFFPCSGDDPLFTIRTGNRVKQLDRNNRRLLLASGEALPYDRLILAHGGEPYVPEILAGPPCQGIFPVRNLTTARAAKAWLADHHRKVVIVGGSLVGVKTAVHLREAGFEVALVVRRGHILLRALSSEAAQVVEDHLGNIGVHLYLNADLEEIKVKERAIEAVRAGERWLPCNTLLMAVGTAPGTDFLEGTGLLKEGQLVVSPALQTADPRIFAAGDVAVIAVADGQKISPNTWPQAVSQGRTAAENLYRKTPVPHNDLTRVNVIDLCGLSMVILGPPPIEGAELISYARPEESVRRELFLVRGKPVGGSLIGDISAAGALRALIKSGTEMDDENTALLKPRSRNIIRFREDMGRQALILSSKRSRI